MCGTAALRTSSALGNFTGGGGGVDWHLHLHEFPDGRKLYVFPRYGAWDCADIYGLGTVLSPAKIDAMVHLGGCCIVYTHLGKRPAHAMERAEHIPDGTKVALRHLADAFRARRMMVSPVGDLLDYLVVRERIEAEPRQNRILLRPDGIRYLRLDRAALRGMKFSFKADGFNLETLQVATPDGPLDGARVVEESREQPQEEARGETREAARQIPSVFSLEF